MTIYEVFKAEVAKAKRLKHLTNADIAALTGFAKRTIDIFMSSGPKKARDDSEKVALAIAAALEIKL